TVSHNTFGGNARSGDATNENSTTTIVRNSNGGFSFSGCCSSGNWGGNASIENTGPGSRNEIFLRGLGSASISNTGPDSVNVIRENGNSWNSFFKEREDRHHKVDRDKDRDDRFNKEHEDKDFNKDRDRDDHRGDRDRHENDFGRGSFVVF